MSGKHNSHRVSREHFSVAELGESDEKYYWRSRTVEERLEYMEYLRQINRDNTPKQRLQRFFEVVEFPQS